MKIKRHMREPEDISFASTADIAFLLIIFFLAASALLEFRGIKLPLPQKDAPPMTILKENIFRVNVNADGGIYHDEDPVDLDQLQTAVRDAYGENQELVVILSISPEAPSARVPEVIDRLQKEGIVRISVSMEES